MKTSLKCSCGNARFGFNSYNKVLVGSLFRLDDNSGLELIICQKLDSPTLEFLKRKVNQVICLECHRLITIQSLSDSVVTELVVILEPEVIVSEEATVEQKELALEKDEVKGTN